jgi:Flp pilus assembly protein TadG
MPFREADMQSTSAMFSRQQQSRKSGNPRRGVTLVETAVVLNLFLLLMFGIMEYGRFVLQGQVLINAAREGARYAAVNTTTATTTQVQNYVTSYLAGQIPSNLVIQVYQADPNSGANIGSWNNANTGSLIAVQITGTYQPMLPITSILPGPVPLSATCVTYCEAIN